MPSLFHQFLFHYINVVLSTTKKENNGIVYFFMRYEYPTQFAFDDFRAPFTILTALVWAGVLHKV